MSCASNKTSATTAFNAASFSGSSNPISVLERTQSSQNTCTLTIVRGKVELDLTSYPNGSCLVYFLVAPQTTGSSNSPPVTADSLYHSALTATMGSVNTSSYYANITPTFSAANDCSAADKKYGWIMNAATAAISPTFTYNV